MEGKARKIGKELLKISIIFFCVNLPFLTVTQIMGGDMFFDSFDHPESYLYVKSNRINVESPNNEYFIIQKNSPQGITLTKGDNIIYLKDDGEIQCQRVYAVGGKVGKERYYTTDVHENINEEPIYEYQIIGKVVRQIDDNIWNALSLKIWDLSINNLNPNALFINK